MGNQAYDAIRPSPSGLIEPVNPPYVSLEEAPPLIDFKIIGIMMASHTLSI